MQRPQMLREIFIRHTPKIAPFYEGKMYFQSAGPVGRVAEETRHVLFWPTDGPDATPLRTLMRILMGNYITFVHVRLLPCASFLVPR
jgi:hypothetical protein